MLSCIQKLIKGVSDMTSLHIRDFPEGLKARLKAAAAMQQKTLYQLVIDILTKAIKEVKTDNAR